ncbi:MAG: flagellar protein FlaG [Alphaproteobacteria bacterium]
MVDAVSASLPQVLPASGATTPTSDSAIAQALPGQAVTPAPTLPGQKSTADQTKSKEFDNKALDKIASRLVALDSRLAISRDDVIQRFIYKFVNPDSGKVVQQYPQQMTLDSLHAMAEEYQRFLDRQA